MGEGMLIVDRPWQIAIALVVGLGICLSLDVLRRKREFWFTTSSVPVVLLIGQALLLSWVWIARDLGPAQSSGRQYLLRYEFGWIALVVGVVLSIVLSWSRRPAFEWPRVALGLGLLGIVGSQAISAWMAGIYPRVEIYAPILLIISTLVLFPLPMTRAVNLVLVALGMVCVVSLATVVFDVSWAQFGETRRIPAPFVEGRLRGVVAHPNILAPLAALGLLLAFTRRWMSVRLLLAPMFALTLWLTDGRTQIAATLAVLAGWAFIVILKKIQRVLIRRGIIGAVAAFAAICLVVLGGNSGPSEVRTLNGRTQLWEDAIDYWQSSQIFGVGPDAFDATYRKQSGLYWAYGAHNQILQTLASEGIFGLAFLVIALMVFVAIAVSATGRRKAQLFAVGLVGLATMMVESPFWLELYLPEWFLFISVMTALFSASPDDGDTHDSRAVSKSSS